MTLDNVVQRTRSYNPTGYIHYNRVPFDVGSDYALVADSAKQDRDSYRVRHIIGGDLKRPRKAMGKITEHRDIWLNPDDVERLYIAKAYAPLTALLTKLKRRHIVLTPENVARKFRLSGLKPMVYNGQFVTPLGTIDLLLLDDREIERIGKIAKPLIARYGTLVMIDSVKSILGSGFNSREFHGKIGNEILSVESGNRIYFDLFQIVKAYEHVLERTI